MSLLLASQLLRPDGTHPRALRELHFPTLVNAAREDPEEIVRLLLARLEDAEGEEPDMVMCPECGTTF
jgi:hypothetical protein